MKLIIFIILLLFPLLAHAKDFNEYQIKLLTIAYTYGMEIGWPETVQAILLNESLTTIPKISYVVGDIKNGFGRRSYGRMQIQLLTAQFVITRYGLVEYPTEETLITRLITDDDFNIYIGSIYFNYLYKRFRDWEAAVVAYNKGPGWVKNSREKVSKNLYLKNIRQLIINKVRPFNKKADK